MSDYTGPERRQHRRYDQGPRSRRGENGGSLELSAGGMVAKIRGLSVNEVLLIILTAILAIQLYMSYMHREEMQTTSLELAAALEEVARTQRFYACIISIPMENRLAELQRGHYCAEIAHYQIPRGRSLQQQQQQQ